MGTFPTTRRNLGNTKNLVQMGEIKAFFFVPDGWSLSSSNKLLKAQWQNSLFDTPSNRIHLSPKFAELKDNSEEIVLYKNSLSTQFVRFGRREFEVSFTKSFFFHQALQTYSGAVARVLMVDVNNYIWGQVDSSGTLTGYTVEMGQAASLKLNDGSKPAMSNYVISFADSTEIDQLGGYVDARKFFGQLKELVDVDVTQVGAVAGTNVKVTVTVTADGSSVDGLANVVPDFLVKSNAGVARVVTAVTQDLSVTPGVYSLTVTALAAGDSVTLTTPALLSIPGYESTGPVVTV